MKIKSLNRGLYGQANIVPFAGEVQIGEGGIVEIESKEVATSLVEANCGYVFLELEKSDKLEETEENKKEPEKDPIEPQVEENNLEKVEKDELGTTKEDTEEDLVGILKSMKVVELQEQAAPFPKEEWSTLKKAELVDYLASHLNTKN